MEYLKISEVAKQWGLSERGVQSLCAQGKIEGATRFGRSWMIPRDARKPLDGRTKSAKARANEDMPLPRKTPFLYMSDLYHTPGTADDVGESLAHNPEAQVLFEAEVAYSRGDIDKVYESANYLLGKRSGFYAVLSAGMLLAMCAIWKGDIEMWRRAKIHIAGAPAKTDRDRDVMKLSISALNIMLYSVESFPSWFKMGCFDHIHKDSHPAAKVYYAKYLYTMGYSVATGDLKIPGVEGLYVMSELHLRLTCAAAYHRCGNPEEAARHVDQALELVLPDRLYGVLAEYCRALDTLVEKRLSLIDPKAWKEVNQLYKDYNEGWSKLSGMVRGKKILTTLSTKEREVATLAAFGLSNQEIADKLGISIPIVKQAVRIVSEKSGLPRAHFAAIL